jgi:hypothetical protein
VRTTEIGKPVRRSLCASESKGYVYPEPENFPGKVSKIEQILFLQERVIALRWRAECTERQSVADAYLNE